MFFFFALSLSLPLCLSVSLSVCLSPSLCVCVYVCVGVCDQEKGVYRVRLVAELSQTPDEEEEVVPLIVQVISPPFLGRTVLTAGPAKFGMDLTKQEHGVSKTLLLLFFLNKALTQDKICPSGDISHSVCLYT